MTRVLYLVGPTASGKKQVARRVAEPLRAALLSLDSVKVYQGMDRGSDKDPRGRFALTDLVTGDQDFSVGAYVDRAVEEVARVRRSGRVPLFVGGTGLYLRALVRGLFQGPRSAAATRERVRRRLEEVGAGALHEELRDVDPEAADRIHPRDSRRITRALEVYQETGRAMTEWQRSETVRPLSGLPVLVGIHRSRDDLRHRIEGRVDRMLEQGLVDEVRELQKQGALGEVAAGAIGYREILEHLEGAFDLATCRIQIVHHTWQFSRRQMNWFRQFPELQWVEATDRDLDEVAPEVEQAFQERPEG